MSNEAVTQTQSQNSDIKNTASVDFDGKKYSVKRLKAGGFYRALKTYMEMIQDVIPKNVSANTKEEDAEFDFDKLIKSLFEKWPEKKTELVAICCENATLEKPEDGQKVEPISKEFILENAYPEEIDKAFEVVIKLNNFADNLKNSAAPMQGLKALNLVPRK